MAVLVYALCTAAALLCTLLLLRGYLQTGTRLLLWSTVCFVGLTVNNVLVIVDLVILPDVDLAVWRTAAGLVGVVAMLFGLLWERRR
ncbi:MAG TPA: DUF5985 family protein [Burkholderiales bacterium]|nr:DUF5985 family protein [Burkholderiales bacterium]